MKTKLLILFTLAIAPVSAHAFPEMIRHNYVNCTSCHVSPSGGGLLTKYGRELSGELMSTKSNFGDDKQSETDFAYGAVKTPDDILLGGDYRGLYLYQNTPYVAQGDFILMEAQLEGAYQYKQFTFDESIGYQNIYNETNPNWSDHLLMRRVYLNYRPTDELSFRVGKFEQQFGINTPEHIIATKQPLGLDEGSETYNLEAAWLGDMFNFYVTADFGGVGSGLLQGTPLPPGVSMSMAYNFLDHFKIGASYLHTVSDSTVQDVVGPWAILGFTTHLYLLTEVDFQSLASRLGAPTTWGMADYTKLGYEVIQGWHLFLMQDLYRSDFNMGATEQNSFGIGTQFLPRPHFDFQLTWQFLRPQGSGYYNDYAYLMMHFYP